MEEKEQQTALINQAPTTGYAFSLILVSTLKERYHYLPIKGEETEIQGVT